VTDPADKISGWLVAVCRMVVGACGMLAMTGSTGAMVCRKLGGTVSESDEAEQFQGMCAGVIGMDELC